MYDTVNSAFTDALKREGKVINSYLDNTPYNVIFRRNSDTNKIQNTLTIYYSADSTVHAGQLLKYKGKTYLAINQETSENDTYLRSDLFETNASITSVLGGIESITPIYAYDLASVLGQGTSLVLTVGGNLKLITEDNATSRALTLNTVFVAMGGAWKIVNLIYKEGVAYIYVERDSASAPVYTLSITSSDSYYVGDTAIFTATAKSGTDTITNATIQWSSSDTLIATIDSTGHVSFIAEGSVVFTALWVEHNLTATKSITISTKQVTPTYKWYWSDDGSTKTYITTTDTATTLEQLLEGSYRTISIEKWFGTTIADTNDTYTFHLDAGAAPSSNYTAVIVNTYEYKITNNAMFTDNYMKVTATSSTSGLLPLTVQFLLGGAF